MVDERLAAAVKVLLRSCLSNLVVDKALNITNRSYSRDERWDDAMEVLEASSTELVEAIEACLGGSR